ncbi:hypothetical protein J2S74_004249 [Evansella vedderi]|uniref:Uncharacterized protein n=1 Tax=Evansella vedderi TaxID=38282 RepID=A0ABU0A1E3_9BACI|nr:hypothetical protein [Evansella vedderi]MDQ0256827.1 hypothetical protein [Evansella vedderi]
MTPTKGEVLSVAIVHLLPIPHIPHRLLIAVVCTFLINRGRGIMEFILIALLAMVSGTITVKSA